MRFPRSLVCVCASAVLCVAGSLPAFADETGSLDNLWEDQSASQGAPVPSGQPTSAPMCSLSAFQQSDMVAKGGWPGVGPFKEGAKGPYDLVDNALNHLKVRVDDDKVTEAELSFSKDKVAKEDLLDLEMSVDFLLEAVGAKPRKIADFNQQLEKNKERLLSKNPVNLQAGKYLVSIARRAEEGGTARLSVRVNSRDISQDALKEHSIAAQSEGTGNDGLTEPTGASETGITAPIGGEIASAQGASTRADSLKEEFLAVVKNWQTVKKAVTRSRQTSQLSQVLSGKALTAQTNTINWLVTNRKYWDITPRGVVVEKYTELVPGKKYVVLAQVKQSRKYVDDASGQVLKETNDDDRVNYTIEKVGDRWLITDYAIGSGSTSQAVRPQTVKR